MCPNCRRNYKETPPNVEIEREGQSTAVIERLRRNARFLLELKPAADVEPSIGAPKRLGWTIDMFPSVSGPTSTSNVRVPAPVDSPEEGFSGEEEEWAEEEDDLLGLSGQQTSTPLHHFSHLSDPGRLSSGNLSSQKSPLAVDHWSLSASANLYKRKKTSLQQWPKETVDQRVSQQLKDNPVLLFIDGEWDLTSLRHRFHAAGGQNDLCLPRVDVAAEDGYKGRNCLRRSVALSGGNGLLPN
jgi:hypothetical protein